MSLTSNFKCGTQNLSTMNQVRLNHTTVLNNVANEFVQEKWTPIKYVWNVAPVNCNSEIIRLTVLLNK